MSSGGEFARRRGALTVLDSGPVEGMKLADILGVTDGGPWAQHNMPCPVCTERQAVVDIAGWVFGPCPECQRQGWELRLRPARRWWAPWRR